MTKSNRDGGFFGFGSSGGQWIRFAASSVFLSLVIHLASLVPGARAQSALQLNIQGGLKDLTATTVRNYALDINTQQPIPYADTYPNGTLLPTCQAVCPKLYGGATASTLSVTPCNALCAYNRTFLFVPGVGDLTSNGIVAGTQGIFDAALFGHGALNIIDSIYYVYEPPRGMRDPREPICQQPARKYSKIICGFRPGEVNPQGLRRISTKNGKQLFSPSTLDFAPILMEYDILSQSLLFVAQGYPRANPATTDDGVPILSFLAINETTGKLAEPFNNPGLTGGPFSVTFCKSCDTGPVGISLPYDYTSVAFGLHAWDQLAQTMYFVLWNPAIGEQTKTLFGVSRVTSTSTGDTKPDIGKWTISIQFGNRFQYYKFPERLEGITALKFSAQMTQLTITQQGPVYGPIDSPTNQKAVLVVGALKEVAGPCAPATPTIKGGGRRCGSILSQADVWAHNNATLGRSDTIMGQLTYDPANPPVCLCPSALVQLNINVERALAVPGQLMSLGNTGLDPSGAEYTILHWLDDRYQDKYRRVADRGLPPTVNAPGSSLLPFVSAIRSMQPFLDDQSTGEQPAMLFMEDMQWNETYHVISSNLPPEVASGQMTLQQYGGPFGISQYTYRTDLVQVLNFSDKIQLPHPVLFAQNKYQYSKAVETIASNLLTLATSARSSLLNAADYGILGNQYVCTVTPNSTIDTSTRLVVKTADYSCQDCLRLWQSIIETNYAGHAFLTQTDFRLFWAANLQAIYPGLFYQSPNITTRTGQVIIGSWNFQCPTPCDAYTCQQCSSLFNRPCAIYVKAGQDVAMAIQAVNIFGRPQTVLRDDNFTVTITSVGNGFQNATGNPIAMPEGKIQLGPVFRFSGDDFTLRGGTVPSPAPPGSPPNPLEDPLALHWDYPNYHNPGAYPRPLGNDLRFYYQFQTLPNGTMQLMKITEQFSQFCNTSIYRDFADSGKCFRYLTRPRVYGNGGGQYIFNFGLDYAGEYQMQVTLRGDGTYNADYSFDLGEGFQGSPFKLIVLPGDADNRTTRAAGAGIVGATVGTLSTFTIQSYDRFGNAITTGGSQLSVTLKSKDYITATYPSKTSTPWEPLYASESSFVNITDNGDGSYLVRYFYTFRARSDPFLFFDIRLNGQRIRGPDSNIYDQYTVAVGQAPTKGNQTFAYQARQTDVGLGVSSTGVAVVAGVPSVFSIQAADRFGNLQGSANNTQADPFLVALEDTTGKCVYDIVPGFPDPGGPQIPGVTCYRNSNPALWGASGPVIQITYPRPDVAQYDVNYTVYGVGTIKLSGMLNYERILVRTGTTDKVMDRFEVPVTAAETYPPLCRPSGNALVRFTAGSTGPRSRGEEYQIQLRDRYNNTRAAAEAIYSNPASNLPFVQAIYQYNCTDFLRGQPSGCTSIITRSFGGVTLYDQPIRNVGDTLYRAATGEASMTTSMTDLQNGSFLGTLYTTLAGRYDVGIFIKPVTLEGNIIPGPAQAVVGRDGNAGTATALSPYLAPYILEVLPSDFSAAYTELVSIYPLTSTSTTRGPGTTVYSSIHSLLYNVRPSNGVTAAPLAVVFGQAGVDSYFFLQCRDQYGNAMTSCPLTPQPTVQISASTVDGTVTVGTSTSSTPDIMLLGNGVYKVNYRTNLATTYSARIAFGSNEVRPLTLDTVTATYVPDTESLYQIQVLPNDPTANTSQPYGNGLRGTLRGESYTSFIYVQFRDAFNNVWFDVSQNGVDTKGLASRTTLTFQVCTSAASSSCNSQVLSTGVDNDYVIIDPAAVKTGAQGDVQIPYRAKAAAPISGTFFLKVNIQLDGQTLGGPSDVYATNPEDYLLRLSNNGGSTPDAVYAAVVRPEDLGYSVDESGISQVNGVDIRQFKGGIVGDEYNMIFQPRDTFGIDIPASYAQQPATKLGFITVKFYRIGDVNARAPSTLTTQAAKIAYVRGLPLALTLSKRVDSQSFSSDPAVQFDQYITYNSGNGTYSIQLPRIDDVMGSAVANLIQSGTYAMMVETRKAGSSTFGVAYINPRLNLVFYPAQSDARAVIIRNCTTWEVVLSQPGAQSAYVEAGSALDFCLEARDRFGNMAVWLPFQGGEPISGRMVRFGGGDNADISATYTDNQNGTYRLSFNQVIAGSYKVVFSIRGVSMTNSNGSLPLQPIFPLDTGTGESYLPLRIFPTKIDPSQCIAVFFDRTRVDQRSTTSGALLTVYIQETDRFGNQRTQLTLGTDGRPVYFQITFTQIGNATNTWTIAAGSSISVQDLGVTVDSTFTSKSLARVSLTAKSIVGAYVGYLLDPNEDPGLHVFNYLSGGARAPYFYAGNFLLSITWPGSPGVDPGPINGSPYTISVDPGPVSAAVSTVFGDNINNTGIYYTRVINGISSKTGRSGESQSFLIQSKDQYGNLILQDVAAWVVIVQPKPGGRGQYTTATITYVGAGVYQATYIPTASDELLLTVTNGATPIPSSQFLSSADGTGLTQTQYTTASGVRTTVANGVVVTFDSGPLGFQLCFAEDNLLAVTGATRVGDLKTTTDKFAFTVKAFDILMEEKTNRDYDSWLEAYVEYLLNADGLNEFQSGDPVAFRPWVGTDQGKWQRDPKTNYWVWNFGELGQRVPGTNEFTWNLTAGSEDPIGLAFTKPGYYNLHVVVRFLNGSAVDVGAGIKTSPYQLHVTPGVSSGGDSKLLVDPQAAGNPGNSAGGSSRRRMLEGTAPDPEEHAVHYRWAAHHYAIDFGSMKRWEAPVDEVYYDRPLYSVGRRIMLEGRRHLAEKDIAYGMDVGAPEYTSVIGAYKAATSGAFKSFYVDLRDPFGNPMQFDPRRIDKLVVRIGEDLNATADGSSGRPCKWLQDTEFPNRAPVVDPSSPPDCFLVFLDYNLLANGSHTSPNYNEPQTSIFAGGTGLALSVINDVVSGSFLISFTPDSQLPAIPDKVYLISVLLNGVPLNGSPYTLRIDPGDASGPRSEILTDLSPLQGVVGNQSEFAIRLRDNFGNQHVYSLLKDNIVVEMRLNTGQGTVVRGCTFNAQAAQECFRIRVVGAGAGVITNGLYRVVFETTVASLPDQDYELIVRYCPPNEYCADQQNFYNPTRGAFNPNTSAYDTFTYRVLPGLTYASRCTVLGATITQGGIVGKPASFIIQARDQYGNRRLSGGDKFSVLIYKPRSVESAPVTDNGDGTYSVNFNTVDPGQHTIVISLQSTNPNDNADRLGYIQGSPFQVQFRLPEKDGNIVPGLCRLISKYGVVSQLFPSTVAGQDLSLLVQAVSLADDGKTQQYKEQGGDLLVAQILDPRGGTLALNASFFLTDFALNPGNTSDGQISGRYQLDVNGLKYLTRSGVYQLFIRACRSTDATLPMQARSCVSGSVLKDIYGSPFPLRVGSSMPVAANSYAIELTDPDRYLNGGLGWSAGDVLSFTLQLKDQFGNNFDYDGIQSPLIAQDLSLAILGEDTGSYMSRMTISTATDVVDQKYDILPALDGTFFVYLRSNIAQYYTFGMTYLGQPLLNTGARARVQPGAFNAGNSIIRGDLRNAKAGDDIKFLVVARDQYGNELTVGGQDLRFQFSTSMRFTGSGFGDNPLYAQSKSIPEFQDDGFGNLIPVYSYNGSWVYTFGSNSSLAVNSKVSIVDRNDGTYACYLRMEKAGPASANITAMQEDPDSGAVVSIPICSTVEAYALCSATSNISSNNFQIYFDPIQPSPALSYVYSNSLGLQFMNAGEDNYVIFRAYDNFSNPVYSDGYDWTVRGIRGNISTYPLVQYLQAGDSLLSDLSVPIGTYVSDLIKLTVAGQYSLSIELYPSQLQALVGTTLVRTPIPFTVFAGTVYAPLCTVTHALGNRTMGVGQLPRTVMLATAGEVNTFRVATSDIYGNKRQQGGDKFFVQVGFADLGTCADDPNVPGDYICSYTVRTAGPSFLLVTIDNAPVEQPTDQYRRDLRAFELYVDPGPVSPANTVPNGPGLIQTVAGEDTNIYVPVRDSFKNIRNNESDVFYAVVTRKPRRDAFDQIVTVTESFKSTYSFDQGHVITFYDDRAGFYDIVVVYEDATAGLNSTIYDSRAAGVTPLIKPLSSSLATTTAVGDGISTAPVPINQASSFLVIPEDRYGNNLTEWTEILTVTVETLVNSVTQDLSNPLIVSLDVGQAVLDFPSAADAAAFIFAHPDASYSTSASNPIAMKQLKATYLPQVAGQYYVSVLLNNMHMELSPYLVTVNPGNVGVSLPVASLQHPNYCQPVIDGVGTCTTVQGQGLYTAIKPTTGDGQAFFDILVRDIFGNRFLSNSLSNVMNISSCALTNSQNTFCPFKVSVTAPGGGALPGSRVTLAPDYVQGTIRVTLSLPTTGTYGFDVRYFNYQVDSAFSQLAMDGIPIQDSTGASSFSLNVVSGAPSDVLRRLAGGYAIGQGVQGGSAGDLISFTLQPYSRVCVVSGALAADNQYGTSDCPTLTTLNHTIGGLDGSATLTDSSGAQLNVSVSIDSVGDGTYKVSYTVTQAGVYLLNLRLTRDTVTVSVLNQAPVTIYPAPIFPATCQASITNGTVTATAGGLVTLNLACTDRYGNAMARRPFDIAEDHFALNLGYEGDISGTELDTLESTVKVTQGDDGRSTVSLTPRQAGNYTMDVLFYGQETVSGGIRQGVSVPGSPFALYVKAASISARYTILSSLPINSDVGVYYVDPSVVLSQSEALKPVTLLIRARDAFNNVISTGGDADALYLEITEVGRPTYRDQATIVDNGDGSYKATFTPPDAVTYILNLFVRGDKVLPDAQVLAGLLYTANGTITKVATDNVRTVVAGDGLTSTVAGDATTFEIEARDPQGAPKTVGGDTFRVTYAPTTATNEYGVALSSGEMTVLDEALLFENGDVTAIPGQYRVEYQIDEFGEYLVTVELLSLDASTGALDYVPVASSPYTLTVGKRPPPVQTTATLDATGTKVSISFVDAQGNPQPTDRGGLFGLDSCSKVFDDDTVMQLGTGSKCTFPVPETIEVYLGFEATVTAGDKLFFLQNRIKNSARNSAAVSGSSPITIPTDAPEPQIILRAPQRLGRCDDLIIDLSGSYGTSGRNLSYSYGMLPNAPNEARISLILVAATQANVETVTIPGSLLQFNYQYTFTANVTNFLLESSNTVFQVVRRNLTLPNVVIQGKPILRGQSSQNLYVMADVSIDYNNPIDSCRSPAPEMTFTWSLLADQSDGTFDLDPVTKNTRQLFVKKGSLFPGNTYVLQVRGEVVGQPNLYNEATATIETTYAALQAFLEAPMQILEGQPLFIDMSKSVDPDDPTPFGQAPPYPFTPFLFNYDCIKVDDQGQEISDNCFQDGYQLDYSRTDYNLTIPAGALGVGNYTFSVIVTKNPIKDPVDGSDLGRRVQLTKTIEVLSPTDLRIFKTVLASGSSSDTISSKMLVRPQSAPHSVLRALADGSVTRPVIKIRPLSTPTPNYNERLTISSGLDNKAAFDLSKISYEWVVVDGVLDLDDYPNSLGTPKTQPNLVIKPYVLTSGQYYTLRVYARYNVDGVNILESHDEVTFRVNSLPCSGTFSIAPKTGVAGLTTFTLTARGWEDDQQDALQYEFRYYDPTSGNAVPLISRSATNVVDTIVPPVISDSLGASPLTIAVFVIDNLDGKTQQNVSIVVQNPDPTTYVNTFTCDGNDLVTNPYYGCPCNVNQIPPDIAAQIAQGKVLEAWLLGGGNGTACTYTTVGTAGFLKQLTDVQLRVAKGTNNVGVLLTLAKTVSILAVREINRLDAIAATSTNPAFAMKLEQATPDQLREYYYDQKNRSLIVQQMDRVLSAIDSVVFTSQLRKEELDQFGDVIRSVLATPALIPEDAMIERARGDLEQITSQSTTTGVSGLAAQALLDSQSQLTDAALMQDSAIQQQVQSLTTVMSSRSVLLQGVTKAQDLLAQIKALRTQQKERKKRRRRLQTTTGTDVISSLATAGLLQAAPGEDPFAVVSNNFQLSAARSDQASGSFGVPPAPGVALAPSVNITGTLGVGQNVTGDAAFDFVASVAANTDYAGYDPTNVNVEGQVLNFDVRSAGASTPLTVQQSVDDAPIILKIPKYTTGSSCRRTRSTCRYWSEAKQDWVTDGLVEVPELSTDDYIACQTLHFSTFALSGDDVVPQFNLVNPVDSAELFSNINLQNSVAIFVVAFLVFGFAIAIVIGYRMDRRDRARFALEMKISTIDERLQVAGKDVVTTKSSRLAAMLPRAFRRDRDAAKEGEGGFKRKPKTEKEEIQELLDDPSLSVSEKIAIRITKEHELSKIVYLDPTDTFTRPQRLMIMLSVFLGQIAVVALFFGIDPSNIGMKIVIGVITGLLLLPANILFRMLFESSVYKTSGGNKNLSKFKRKMKKTQEIQRQIITYRVTVATTNIAGAGTRSNVGLTIFGDRGDSGVCVLPAGKGIFAQGQTDVFELKLQDLGKFQRLHIALEGSRAGNWHLDHVEIVNLTTGEGATFHCGSWLEKKRDLDQPVKVLEVTSTFTVDPALLNQPPGGPERRGSALMPVPEDGPPLPPPPVTARPQRRWKAVTAGLGFTTAVSSEGYLKMLPPPGALAKLHEEFATPARRSKMRSSGAGSMTPDVQPPPPTAGDAARPRRRVVMIDPVAAGYGGVPGAPPLPPMPMAASPSDGGAARPRRTRFRAAALAGMGAERMMGVLPPTDDTAARPRRVGAQALPRATSTAMRNLAAQDKLERQQRIRKTLKAQEANPIPYVPPPVEDAVIRIQRAWRRKKLVMDKKRIAAALKLQAAFRGHLARKAYKEVLEARKRGDMQGPLWWVAAHAPKAGGAPAQDPAGPLGLKSKATATIEHLKFAADRQATLRTALSKQASFLAGGQPEIAPARPGVSRTESVGLSKAAFEIRQWVKDADRVQRDLQRSKEEEAARQAIEEQIRIAKAREARQRERRRLARERRRRKGLPRWFIWVTYLGCIAFDCVAAFFIILYGLAFPPAVSRAWLMSSLFAIFMEVFVQEPVRIAVITFVYDWVKRRAKGRLAAYMATVTNFLSGQAGN